VTLACLACSKDVVLADQALAAACGNGIVESGEECDVASPGCTALPRRPDVDVQRELVRAALR